LYLILVNFYIISAPFHDNLEIGNFSMMAEIVPPLGGGDLHNSRPRRIPRPSMPVPGGHVIPQRGMGATANWVISRNATNGTIFAMQVGETQCFSRTS
jgi:hypothetical protein